MAKTNRPYTNRQISYASKPAKIGAIIKGLIEEKKIDKKQIAAYMNVCEKSVTNWLHRTFLTIPEMMKLSELFQYNLMALYYPNIPPPPDPNEALRKEIAALRKENTMLEDEKNRALTENIRLRAQNELLMAQVKEFAGKK